MNGFVFKMFVVERLLDKLEICTSIGMGLFEKETTNMRLFVL